MGEHLISKRSKVDREPNLPNVTVLYDQASGLPIDEGRELYDKQSETVIQIDHSAELDASLVKWVDSRPIRGQLMNLGLFFYFFVFLGGGW